MRELEALLNKRWILKAEDKELYYKVRDQLGEIRKFASDKLGCHIIENAFLVKLEKIPMIPESFMGVQEFTSKEEYAFLCLAALIALELFAASGTAVYYSGDFDPEGLWIAQRLAIFYPGTFHFLNMDETSYLKCLSEESISDTRLKQLDRITDSRLFGTVERMRIEKKAGYQEVLTLI